MFGEYIDSHNHMHALNWDEWELLGATGMRAAVLSCGNPHLYREVWDEAPGYDDIMRFWEGPVGMAQALEAQHFIKIRCAVGISSMTRVNDWENLLEEIPGFLEDENVVALGEIGLDPTQYFSLTWPMEEQTACLEAQAELAKKYDKPIILHTPTPKKSKDFLGNVAVQADVPPEQLRLHYMQKDLEIIRKTGFDEARVAVDHTDATTVEHIHRDTRAMCAISIGSALRPLEPAQVIEWVETFGPDRIMLNSDHLGYRPIDILSVPKTLRAMRNAGLSDEAIRKVSFENARKFYDLSL